MDARKIGILLVTATWLGGCFAEADVEQESELQAEATVPSAAFSGAVTDERGTPQSGVTIGINGITRVTDSTGRYFMSVESSVDGYTLTLSKPGFADAAEFLTESTFDRRHVLGAAFSMVVDPTRDQEVVAPSGVSVSLRANSLVTASGTAPVGMVRVTIATYDPLRMPGDFTATNAFGEQVALESVGAVSISANDSVGQALDLRPGMTSQGTIPVPAVVGTMPPCVFNGSCRIAMWKFDPNTGKWIERPGAEMQAGTSGTRFTMRGDASLQTLAIPVSSGGLGMWNADIEKRTPACTIIELVGIPQQCFGASGNVQLSLKLQNAAGTLLPRTDTMSSITPYIVLYNTSPNVIQEVRLTLPSDAPLATCGQPRAASDPNPESNFPVSAPRTVVTRFKSGGPWGGTGFPRDSGGNLIDFMDVFLDNQPCNSHLWFTM